MPDPGVYGDDFANTGSGWPAGSVGACAFGYTSGFYGIRPLAANQVCIVGAPTAAQVSGVFSGFIGDRSKIG